MSDPTAFCYNAITPSSIEQVQNSDHSRHTWPRLQFRLSKRMCGLQLCLLVMGYLHLGLPGHSKSWSVYVLSSALPCLALVLPLGPSGHLERRELEERGVAPGSCQEVNGRQGENPGRGCRQGHATQLHDGVW